MFPLHLKAAGLLLLLLAAFHLAFPKRFNWTEELQRLSLLNRQIFYVHCAFICLTLFLMGALCLFGTAALLEPTSLSRLVFLGFAIFWGVRLGAQWFIYDRTLWHGKRPETAIHLAFTFLWTYFTAVFTYGVVR